MLIIVKDKIIWLVYHYDMYLTRLIELFFCMNMGPLLETLLLFLKKLWPCNAFGRIRIKSWPQINVYILYIAKILRKISFLNFNLVVHVWILKITSFVNTKNIMFTYYKYIYIK